MGTSISKDEIGRLGEDLYKRKIKSRVEIPDNIGKMVIMDLDTEDYEIDKMGTAAARILQARHPNAILYGKRIGYDVSEAIGGVLERTAQ